MRIKLSNGRVFCGGPDEIVSQMREGAFTPPEVQTTREYLEWAVANAQRLLEVTLPASQGDDDEALCRSFLEHIVAEGLAEVLPEAIPGGRSGSSFLEGNGVNLVASR